MIETRTRAAFERMVTSGAGDAGALASGLRREVTGVGLRALAAKLLHVAICDPSRMADVYDNAANGWLNGPVFAPNFRGATALAPSDDFWRTLWDVMDVPAASRQRVAFAEEIMRLAGLLSPELNVRAAAAARDVRGVGSAASSGLPTRPFDPDRLAAYPPSTLGGMLRLEMAARGRTGEIAGADELGLADLPAPLDYTNARALQCHLIWAVVGGYSAGQLDDIALAAFQMGQFRHPFSALVVGLTVMTIAIDRPQGLELVLDSIFKGWMHGRETPLLLGVDWEGLMGLQLEAVRDRLHVRAFESPMAAALRKWSEGRGPAN
ncbi:MAG: hypothetical protein JNK30_16995 [Phenylobacterium sp.]|uniref:hypothetical protein n=1 Tax=Phenylobacterium sp. TaxID=1871053 RepID=UPI001A5CEF59|nr:hypothetical protein [Phenylobacterium sp.]MBL8773082.1 hypothetical protein [Phenylobacterium sp.]